MTPTTQTLPGARAASLLDRYVAVRGFTESLAAPLFAEDQTVQSMPDVSPTKWHRAHTTWFFETFVLGPHASGYQPFDPSFAFLFNSYYEAVGPRHARHERGLLSRPGVARIGEYRQHVDRAMTELLARTGGGARTPIATLTELGIHHEQQHQELLLMDIKHVLSVNPLRPAYSPTRAGRDRPDPQTRPLRWFTHPGGIVEIGHAGDGFAFDNEFPRHRVHLEPFALASRLVTCGEWAEFVDDGGYSRPELWLSDGWAAVCAGGWRSPLYWSLEDGTEFTLAGPVTPHPATPVCHVSYYEADAFARWSGARLPTEAEWEAIAATVPPSSGRYLDPGVLHPTAATGDESIEQLYGDAWEWTASAYLPYPGFRPGSGAVGEYNGKFMVGQHVLRGGCCATPPSHVRATYRNFFPPAARWPFTGVRLARDA